MPLIGPTQTCSGELLERCRRSVRGYLLLQMLNLGRGHPQFFQIRNQPFPGLLTLFSFAQVQLRHLLHRLLQRDRIQIAVVILMIFS